ncbi:hypothetical protein FXN61_07640 [Lentzea sp. PSKA42]|uniref:Uncharacterized protein n=1 Tax=Lentzea indica TaxID=2604800 RepID=A0ABX1FCY2_9PSEU|nr:hypothetical protein [Lentzea indica]NKE56712.1 hypothetical protein [Lentzea indica]
MSSSHGVVRGAGGLMSYLAARAPCSPWGASGLAWPGFGVFEPGVFEPVGGAWPDVGESPFVGTVAPVAGAGWPTGHVVGRRGSRARIPS